MYVKGVERISKWSYTIFAHNSLSIQQIFNFEKSFGKLRLGAFQPYNQILYMSKVLKMAQNN